MEEKGGGENGALAVDAMIEEEEKPYDDDDDDDDVLEGCSCCLRRRAVCLSAKATRRWNEEDAVRRSAMFLSLSPLLFRGFVSRLYE